MLLASGGGLIMADHFTFQKVYFIMGLCMIPGIITTLLSPEPKAAKGMPKTLKDSVIEPLKDYFSRDLALPILAFILLYKIGDTMASGITTYFYLDIGFTKSQIGTIVKVFGTWATIAGGLIGGIIMLKVSIKKALWIFGFLQAISTAGFALLAAAGNLPFLLAAVIAFENLTGGMGTAAYAAFMASITNKKFTATQYALLSSLMGIPRVVLSAPTGIFAEFLGWETFFILCAFAAIPGMIMLLKVMPDNKKIKGNL
jgi:PAT family beta-lactamase induction signal transducer AmpG